MSCLLGYAVNHWRVKGQKWKKKHLEYQPVPLARARDLHIPTCAEK